MSLHQNVSGTLKEITVLTQNVSGALKNLTSLKQNVSGTLKEVFSWSSLPTSLTWTASNGQQSTANTTITSETNSGMTVTAKMYNTGTGAIDDPDMSKGGPKIYSNTFYLEAGSAFKIGMAISSSLSNPTTTQFMIYLVNSSTNAFTAVNANSPVEITTAGNYYFVISGFTMTVVGSQSGITYNYGTVTFTANITFATSADELPDDSGGTSTSDSFDLLTTYPALSYTLSGTAYQGSSGTADSNNASINIDKSKYKYITITVKTSSYCSINYSCELVFNGVTVTTLGLTGAAGNSTDTITIANSSISSLTSNSLTSCYIYLRYANGNGATTSISAQVTTLKFYN